MELKIERVCEDVVFGEGPHWDISGQCLYFVDVIAKTINRYVPETNSHYKAFFDTYPSFITPIEGETNKFVVGLGNDISVVIWDGRSEKVEEIKKLCEIDNKPPREDYRLNDEKCDALGRLWTGTTVPNFEKSTPNLGSIYSFGDGILKNHAGEATCSNGLTWSKDNKFFFFIDSVKRTIDRFDFDIEKGEITNRFELFSFEKNNVEGYPDGMTIDEDDNLWIASIPEYMIIKIDSKVPETLLDTIKLPAKVITSVAWGGRNLDELYVTTGRAAYGGEKLEPPVHGAIYRISGLGAKGLPMINFKL